MYQQTFGSRGQMRFANEHEYYTLLGYLAKSDGSTSLTWEHNENQGAWGSEGRIQIHTANFPRIWQISLTAGRGTNIINRINCNEFVENICTHNGFVYGNRQNIANIQATIPAQYLADFNIGLNIP